MRTKTIFPLIELAAEAAAAAAQIVSRAREPLPGREPSIGRLTRRPPRSSAKKCAQLSFEAEAPIVVSARAACCCHCLVKDKTNAIQLNSMNHILCPKLATIDIFIGAQVQATFLPPPPPPIPSFCPILLSPFSPLPAELN